MWGLQKVKLRTVVFSIMTPCNVVESQQSFAFSLLHVGFLPDLFVNAEDTGVLFLRNVDWLSTDYTALYPRRYITLHNHRCENLKSFIHSFIHHWLYNPSFGPGLLFSFVIFFTQTVGLPGRVISPSQGCYIHTGQHKHRINAHTDIYASSWIRTHDPRFQASKDSSCLRPRGHCDRPNPSSVFVNCWPQRILLCTNPKKKKPFSTTL
jgi:hypothetical protein